MEWFSIDRRASISDPGCTGGAPSNQATCAIIGPNGSLAVAQSSDGAGVSWTTFADLGLGGTQIFNPTCTYAFCGAVTTAGDFRVKFYNGTTWDSNATIVTFPPNISPVSDPSCTMVAYDRGQLGFCGVRGSDSALYVSQLNGSTFSPFQSLGGSIRGAPTCTSESFSPGDNPGAVCAVRGFDNNVYVNQFNNGTWGGFQLLTAVILSVWPPHFRRVFFDGDPSCQLVLTGPGGSSAAVVWCGIKSTASALWVTVSSPPM